MLFFMFCNFFLDLLFVFCCWILKLKWDFLFWYDIILFLYFCWRIYLFFVLIGIIVMLLNCFWNFIRLLIVLEILILLRVKRIGKRSCKKLLINLCIKSLVLVFFILGIERSLLFVIFVVLNVSWISVCEVWYLVNML